MSYRVKQGQTFIESHDDPKRAYRAYLVFLAHERKNGRDGSDLTIQPPVPVELTQLHIEHWNLGPWAEKALEHWARKHPDEAAGDLIAKQAQDGEVEPA